MDFALIRWTVRLALVGYVVTLLLLLDWRGARGARSFAAARCFWTAGCLLLLLHLAAAFHFVHGWSHVAAYRETARQTAETIGIAWGGGVWFNYLFAALWTADAAWWWLAGDERYRNRSRWISLPLHAYLAFVAFNATVVFETGAIRWIGAAVSGIMLLSFTIAGRAGRPRHAEEVCATRTTCTTNSTDS